MLIQLGALYALTDRFEKAVEVWQRAFRAMEQDELAQSISERYAASGPEGYWRTLLELPGSYGFDDGYKAYLYAGLGETDTAFESLERAVDQKLIGLSFLGVWPYWDYIRDDPRFAEQVARLKIPPLPSD